MLRIIVGRAGAGKTHYCLGEISQELHRDPSGPLLLFVVPQESTFAMEQALLQESGLRAISRAQVLGFRRLRWRILQSAGGISEPPLSDMGRRFLLAGLARTHQHELTVFQDVAHHPGFVDKLSGVISELQQAGWGNPTSSVESPVEFTDQGDGVVDAKAHDLALLLQAYQGELCRRGLADDSWCWARAKAGISGSSFLEEADIWIDGFQGFEAPELGLIAGLLQKVKRVSITLRLDPAMAAERSAGVFAYSATTLQRLIGLAEDLSVPYTVEPLPPKLHRFRDSQELAHLEDQLRHSDGNPTPFLGEVDGIVIASAPNYRSEAMDVARFLIGQARDHGVRWRDMAVAASDLALYGELLADIFTDWQVPFFLDQPQAVHWHPLLVFLTSLLEIVSGEWQTAAVMQLLKSDLVQGDRSGVDALENYALARGINGRLWLEGGTWAKMQDDLGPGFSGENALRLVMGFYGKIADSLHEPMLGRQLMLHLWSLLEDLGVPERLDYWENEEQTANAGPLIDHVGIWNLWVDLVDNFMQGLGDMALVWDQFAGLLQAGLDGLGLSGIPLGLDQILITTPARLINSEVRVIVVVGADEQHLRVAGGEDTIVNDGERAALRERNWPLEPRGRIQMLKEPLFWYSLFTRAKDSLYITHSLADTEGRALELAPIVKDLCRFFPQLSHEAAATPQYTRDTLPSPCTIPDAASVVARALSTWREGLAGEMSRAWQNDVLALYNWLIGQEQGLVALRQCLAGLTYTNKAAPLGRATVKRLFGEELHTNIHHLEAAARCPFEFFASAVLRLQERDLLTWDARLEGILWHESLARFTRHLWEVGQDIAELGEAQLQAVADQVWQDTVCQLTDGFAHVLESYDYRVNRLRRAFQRVVAVLAEHSRRGQFRPMAVEVAFGSQQGLPAWHIPLADAGAVYLRGRIDRIEATYADGVLYVRVLDFKRGTRKLRLADVYQGFSLQLLAYLGSLLDKEHDLLAHPMGAHGQEVVLAGALYLPLHEPLVSLEQPMEPEALAKELLGQYKMHGIVLAEDEVIDLMEGELSGWSSLLPVGKKKDGTLYKSSSAYSREGMKTLVGYVKQRIRELGEQILLGNIEIAPYRRTTERACTYCQYMALCRFELGVPGCGYRYIPEMSNADALGSMERAVARSQEVVQERGSS